MRRYRKKKRAKAKRVRGERKTGTDEVIDLGLGLVSEAPKESPETLAELTAKIPEKRKSHVSYMLLSDEEILAELKAEAAAPALQIGSFASVVTPGADIAAEIKSWQELFKECFGIVKDFSKVPIPPQKPGFDRLIIVPANLSCPEILAACRELFKVVVEYRSKVSTGFEDYAIWARDASGPDKRFRGKPVRYTAFPLMTLPERLLFELKFFKESGKHLDPLATRTLCYPARRDYAGDPCSATVCFDYEALTVGSVYDGNLPKSSGVREVVRIETKESYS